MKGVTPMSCERCGRLLSTDTRVESRCETYPVKGESIEISANVRVCTRCGDDIYDRDLDTENLQRALNEYRSKHAIITPDEIRAIREQYRLSQRSLGHLLGWGEVTIHRYENGSLPDEAHNQVLRFLEHPANMESLFQQRGTRLPPKAYQSLHQRLAAFVDRETLPDIYTGFRQFTLDALKEMMVFYASLSGQNGVLKTKLNKLLWYGDFLHFRDHAVSISGAEYVHLPYGPVPDNYERYLYELCADGALLATEKCFSPEYVGENITALRKPRPDFVLPSAGDILVAVYRYFKAFNSKRITECSHAEKGYIETAMLERISYAYADSLHIRLKRK